MRVRTIRGDHGRGLAEQPAAADAGGSRLLVGARAAEPQVFGVALMSSSTGDGMVFKVLTGSVVLAALVGSARAEPLNVEAAPPLRAVVVLVRVYGSDEVEKRSLESHLRNILEFQLRQRGISVAEASTQEEVTYLRFDAWVRPKDGSYEYQGFLTENGPEQAPLFPKDGAWINSKGDLQRLRHLLLSSASGWLQILLDERQFDSGIFLQW